MIGAFLCWLGIHNFKWNQIKVKVTRFPDVPYWMIWGYDDFRAHVTEETRNEGTCKRKDCGFTKRKRV